MLTKDSDVSILDNSPGISSLWGIYDTLVDPAPSGRHKPGLCMFIMWNAWGHKFAQLASSGSLYILVLVAGLDLSWSVSRVLGRVPFEVGKILRRPDDSPAGKLVHSQIIPTIAYMRERLPLCWNNRSCHTFAVSRELSGIMDFTSLKYSDGFFDCLKRK